MPIIYGILTTVTNVNRTWPVFTTVPSTISSIPNISLPSNLPPSPVSYHSFSDNDKFSDEDEPSNNRDVLLASPGCNSRNESVFRTVLKTEPMDVKQEVISPMDTMIADDLLEIHDEFKFEVDEVNSDLDFDTVSTSSGSHFEFSDVSDMLSDIGVSNDCWSDLNS